MEEQRERAIARGLAVGDPKAWEALYEAFSEQVWRSVARLVGPDAETVADVVQETFLAAARSARGYSAAKGSLWSWLYGIARNQVALHYRQRQRSKLLLAADWISERNGELAEWVSSGGRTPEETLERDETAALIRAALGELSDEHALLLTAKYLDGRAIDELATLTAASSTAVRSKLARARRAFRTAFLRLLSRTDVGVTESEHEP